METLSFIRLDLEEMDLINCAWPFTPEEYAQLRNDLDCMWDQDVDQYLTEDEDDDLDISYPDDPYFTNGVSRDDF